MRQGIRCWKGWRRTPERRRKAYGLICSQCAAVGMAETLEYRKN